MTIETEKSAASTEWDAARAALDSLRASSTAVGRPFSTWPRYEDYEAAVAASEDRFAAAQEALDREPDPAAAREV